jgi:hypothetical protein
MAFQNLERLRLDFLVPFYNSMGMMQFGGAACDFPLRAPLLGTDYGPFLYRLNHQLNWDPTEKRLRLMLMLRLRKNRGDSWIAGKFC